MQNRELMNVQHALSGRHSNACTSQAVNPPQSRASSSKFVAASARAVRPLAASARLEQFGKSSGLCAEPSFGIAEKKACSRAHSFLPDKKNPMFGKAQVTPREVIQRKIRAGCAAQAAMPNPSIERDVQRLAPLAAPHVKR